MERPEILENIGEVRRLEMERAREILGVEQRFMGFVRLRPAGGRERAAARGLLRADAAEIASERRWWRPSASSART
ncbi:hypothetical protein GCM10018952_75430 [Streptosporangium vulgare]